MTETTKVVFWLKFFTEIMNGIGLDFANLDCTQSKRWETYCVRGHNEQRQFLEGERVLKQRNVFEVTVLQDAVPESCTLFDFLFFD